MPIYYHNPDNALKRANEFCELGKYDEALECLYDALKNRKSRIMKHVHEMIINKLLELCVEQKKSQMAKDGLYSYRILCQGINIKSWEDTIFYYLKLSEGKVESALEAIHSVVLEIDDLDQDMTPEILLKSVSSEDAQDRKERVILLPWIKFLWECYRNCLDLLRNSHNIRLYHTLAKNAFRFCVKFSRKSELRKLCNIVKMHAIYMQNKPSWLKTNNVETHLMCLDTGFVELDSAIKMELWQDAFKAIENIHVLMSAAKTLQHSKVMAHYYHKVSLVFWKGEEYLFHAAANLRYFSILKEQKKNLSSCDIIKLASRLMLSILVVPPPSVNPATDLIVETDLTVIHRKTKLLTSLLFLPKCPTRASLIKDAVQLNIIQYLPEELAELFQTLEINSDQIFPTISVFVNFIKTWSDGELEEYIPLLQKVHIAKLLFLVSNFYANIKMTKFLTLTGISQMSDLETMLAELARRLEFPLRIDHRNMCVHFSNDFNIKNEKNWDESLKADLEPDANLRWLTNVHSTLKCAVRQIHPKLEKKESKTIAEEIERRYFREKESYRKFLLQRKTVIEKYKETLEKSRLKKEEDERRCITEKHSQYEAAEKERLQREAEERKLQRLRKEQEEIKRKLFLEKMETLKKNVLGNQIVESLQFENMESFDPQILFCKQVEQLNKERKQLNLRLKRQERHLDHLERAKRIEEIPLLIEQYEKKKGIDEKMWNEAVKNKIDAAYKKREQELRKKNRVLKIKPDLQIFLESVKKRNLESYEKEMAYVKMLEEERKKRLKKRAEERKQKRKEDWIKQNKIKQNVKNMNIKTPVSPKKNVTTATVDEIVFSKDVSSRKEKASYSESGKGKCDSTETSKEIPLSSDIYYFKRTYKSDAVEAERTEVYEKKASVFSEFSSDLHTKLKHQRPHVYSASDQRIRTSIFESSTETRLSWRTPWARKDAYTKVPPQNISILRRESQAEAPRQNISILRRENQAEAPRQNITIQSKETKSLTANFIKDKKDSEIQSRKLPKSESQRSDVKYSCTPWSKLKRQDVEK